MALLTVLAVSAAVGFALQRVYGDFVDIPPEVTMLFQGINGLNLSLAVAAMWLSSHGRSDGMPRPLRRIVRSQERHALLVCVSCVATFAVLAFYELFPYGYVAGFAFFHVFWLARLAVEALVA